MIDLDELQRIASAATAGPWLWSEDNSPGETTMGRMLTESGKTIFDFGDCTRYYPTEGTEPDAADVLFMQAANPSVILDLIGIARAAADSLPKIKEGAKAPSIRTWQERCDWDSGGATTWQMIQAMKAEIADWRVAAALAGAAPVEAAKWVSVTEQMPEKKCIATYVNSHGKRRTIHAQYVARFTVEAQGDDCYSEYREDDDTEYLMPGWYECIDNWGDFSSVFVNEGEVTHWMPLPAAPAPEAQ